MPCNAAFFAAWAFAESFEACNEEHQSNDLHVFSCYLRFDPAAALPFAVFVDFVVAISSLLEDLSVGLNFRRCVRCRVTGVTVDCIVYTIKVQASSRGIQAFVGLGRTTQPAARSADDIRHGQHSQVCLIESSSIISTRRLMTFRLQDTPNV